MRRKPDDLDDPARLLIELARKDFRVFLRRAFPVIRGGDLLLWNWHLDAIAYQLSEIEQQRLHRLLVTMPPRNLKSIAISVAWVAWMLGRDPRSNFVCVSYSNELSGKLARMCIAIVQSSWYRELFPRTILSPKRSASGDFETTLGGGRLATSVTGTLTGRGGDIIIVDDPIKPDEAHSETTREFVNEWFRSTLASRLDDKAKGSIIVVMQRLHQYDLAGALIESGDWLQLSLPAIANVDETVPLMSNRFHHRKVGDLLHPAHEGAAALSRQKQLMGSINFEAQSQQNPVPADGNLVRAEWLKTYPADFEPVAPGQIVQSWDTASKEGLHNDWSVCITAHVRRNEVRILDVFRRRMTIPDLKRHAIRLAREYRANALLVEDAASGEQLIQLLRFEQPRDVPLPIPCKPEGDKQSRMAGVSAQIEAGHMMLPQDAHWLGEFKSELLGFPNARFDDQADALTQLMNWVLRTQPRWPSSNAGPILFEINDDGSYRQIGGDFDLDDHNDYDGDPWGG